MRKAANRSDEERFFYISILMGMDNILFIRLPNALISIE